MSNETRLVQELLRRYELIGTTISRPRMNSSRTVVLRFGLRLITLDLDEKHQTLTTSAWLRHVRSWFNVFLISYYSKYIYDT